MDQPASPEALGGYKNPNGALVAIGASMCPVRKNPHPGGEDFVILLDGQRTKVEYLERPERPFRKSGLVNVYDVDSFITNTNRHAETNDSMIYASLDPLQIVGVMNDHTSVDTAGWRDHLIVFPLAHSKEYLAWKEAEKQTFGQEAFADFVEDNLPDFRVPAGAKMLEYVLNFKVNRKMAFKSVINQSDGTAQLEYSDREEGGATGPARRMAMPSEFIIRIPVWSGLGQVGYDFNVKLRYRVENAAVLIKVKLHRPHKVIEQAFADLLDKIKKGVKDVPLTFGNIGNTR